MRGRLLFLTTRFAPDIGGVASSATRIAQSLARAGYELEVYCWTRSLDAGEEAVHHHAEQVRVHRIGSFGSEDLSMQHLLTLLEDRHRAAPFTAAWGHYLLPSGYLAVLFARLVGIPVVASARGNDVDRLMFPPGDFARLTWTVRSATVVTAVSGELAAKLAVVEPEAKVRVLHNAVNATVFSPDARDDDLRGTLGIPEDVPVIGFSGELRYKKGAEPLLAAFARLVAEREARLLIIGEPRAREREHLDRLAAIDATAAERIIVTGHIDDSRAVAAHLCLCDVVVVPSLWDGLPNALLEAMACARPVIAAAAGGIPEVLRHGVDGVLIGRGELGRLDEALIELLDATPEQRDALGAAARERVCTSFTPEGEDQELAAVLDGIASTSS